MEYIVRCSHDMPETGVNWDSPAWSRATTAALEHFRPEGSSHRPKTQVRLLYDGNGIHGIFHVEDRYVRCVHTAYMGEVYKDSCVEFFIKPRQGRGYFNFEFNCGGALRAGYIIDPTRVGDGFKEWFALPAPDGAAVRVNHSLPAVVDPEIGEPLTWTLAFFIPFALLEKYSGTPGRAAGQTWRGNFYKCADASSRPHWASWAPLAGRNFHLPNCFGAIRFEDGTGT
jgi:hypothetical protein